MDLTYLHLHNVRHMAYAFCTQYHQKKKKKRSTTWTKQKNSTSLSNIVTGTLAVLSHTALITGTITSNKPALFNNIHTSPAAVEASQPCLRLENQALLPLLYVSNVVHMPKRAKACRMRGLLNCKKGLLEVSKSSVWTNLLWNKSCNTHKQQATVIMLQVLSTYKLRVPKTIATHNAWTLRTKASHKMRSSIQCAHEHGETKTASEAPHL